MNTISGGTRQHNSPPVTRMSSTPSHPVQFAELIFVDRCCVNYRTLNVGPESDHCSDFESTKCYVCGQGFQDHRNRYDWKPVCAPPPLSPNIRPASGEYYLLRIRGTASKSVPLTFIINKPFNYQTLESPLIHIAQVQSDYLCTIR
jgi:hypothetical protein